MCIPHPQKVIGNSERERQSEVKISEGRGGLKSNLFSRGWQKDCNE